VSTPPKPIRVLIADDHAPTRTDVRRALDADERFKICADTADAASAVQAAVRERPDVCLLDIRMPGGGLSAAWEIAARLPRAKIVMLTVSGEDADLFAALRAGAEGYLLKTMDFAWLPDVLTGVCSGEAAIPPALVSRVLRRFRTREPRWRQPLDHGSAERLTSREWEVLFSDDASHERLDTVPQRELIERIEYAAALSLEKLRPSMVLLPARSFNQDHVATFRACMAATRPASAGARHLVPYVLAYDNTTAFWAAPDEWSVPNVFVDISEYVDVKVEAVRRYRSQLRRPPFHASPQGLQTAAAFYGGQVSVAAAEAFQALRLAW
jgi:DNA-binding NarL/FixJ family response regulator